MTKRSGTPLSLRSSSKKPKKETPDPWRIPTRAMKKWVAKSITEGFTLAGAGAGHVPEDIKNLIIDFVL